MIKLQTTLLKIGAIFLLIFISYTSYCQSNESSFRFVKYLELKIENDTSYIYKDTVKQYVGSADTILVSKEVLNKYFENFSELAFIVEYNYRPTIKFYRDAIRCYNTNKNMNKDPNLLGTYEYFVPSNGEFVPKIEFFQKFDLVQRIEDYYAPPLEAIKLGMPIGAEIRALSFTNYNGMGQISGHGESMKVNFTFGSSPFYKKGPFFSNLDKCFGDDLEARSYIKLYKNRMRLRWGIILSGYALLAISLDSFAGNRLTNFDSDFVIATALPGVFMANIGLFWSKNKMKLKFIVPAINTYNQNLVLR